MLVCRMVGCCVRGVDVAFLLDGSRKGLIVFLEIRFAGAEK
jgi:hypothetical protein